MRGRKGGGEREREMVEEKDAKKFTALYSY
jgi:hypothetical protein